MTPSRTTAAASSTIATTTTTTTATCQTCGGEFPYEPVLCFGRDLAAHLKKECPPCQEASERKRRNEREEDRMRHAYQLLCTTLPLDLRQTDEQHPEFNLRLWQAVSRWHPSADQRSLGIIGPAAMCKTRVLSLLARRTISTGTRIAWTSAVRLKDAAHDRQSRDREISAIAREHLRECLTAPWLFLDDLGKNEWTSAFESQLFQILDHRLNHHLPIAWTANDHPEVFHHHISPLNASPIIGRLLDRCTVMDLRA